MKIIISILTALLFLSGIASAHPGRLDKEGCHRVKKTGSWHCHK